MADKNNFSNILKTLDKKSKWGDNMVNELPRVLKKADEQIGKSNWHIDKKRTAMTPGKRLSKNNRVYYEKRKNRSDKANKVWL